jgi:hypothetical protein
MGAPLGAKTSQQTSRELQTTRDLHSSRPLEDRGPEGVATLGNLRLGQNRDQFIAVQQRWVGQHVMP